MRGFLLIALLFSFSVVYSQAVMDFEQTVHDFGNIKEVNGPVSYEFVFVNRGNAPILIKNVESSCGCTSPLWSKQPVLPGKTGFIKATFDPTDRPSYFDKTITVFSNAKPAVVELKIKGNVEARARTVLDDFPYELPSGLRLPLDHISMMKVKKGEVKKLSIGVYNNSGKEAVVSFVKLPSHLQIAMEPARVAVKGKAVLNVSYNTADHGEYGLNKENVRMVVNGKEYMMPLTVFVEEDFSTADRSVAPVLSVEKKYHNFGSLPGGKQAEFVYKLINEGKSLLKIHRCYVNDDRIELDLPTKELQPGESVNLTVKTRKGAGKGKLSGLISVITNCPDMPEMNLRFYGTIE